MRTAVNGTWSPSRPNGLLVECFVTALGGLNPLLTVRACSGTYRSNGHPRPIHKEKTMKNKTLLAAIAVVPLLGIPLARAQAPAQSQVKVSINDARTAALRQVPACMGLLYRNASN